MWDFIVLVPGHCLSIYLSVNPQFLNCCAKLKSLRPKHTTERSNNINKSAAGIA